MDNFIFICSACILNGIDNLQMYTIDTLTYKMDLIEEGRIRITVHLNEEVELGALYFEKAKRSFNRKPVSMDAWACVDAKVEGLYVHGGDEITPKDIVAKCQSLISSWSMR